MVLLLHYARKYDFVLEGEFRSYNKSLLEGYYEILVNAQCFLGLYCKML